MDSDASFSDLRNATAEHSDYDPYFSVTANYGFALGQVVDGQPEDAKSICGNLSVTFFVAIRLQQACADRLRALGNTAADNHQFVAEGLVAALKPDGDGYVAVINPEEEYDFVSLKNYKVIGHATLRAPGGQRISALKVRDESGNEFYVKFVKHPSYESIQRKMIRDALEDSGIDEP